MHLFVSTITLMAVVCLWPSQGFGQEVGTNGKVALREKIAGALGGGKRQHSESPAKSMAQCEDA
jgi:hypothetical protein